MLIQPEKLQFKPRSEIEPDGREDAKIWVLTDSGGFGDSDRFLTDYAGRLILDQFRQQGWGRTKLRIEGLYQRKLPGKRFWELDYSERIYWQGEFLKRLEEAKTAFGRPHVIFALGEETLKFLTGKSSIDKWHGSILEGPLGTKVVPTFTPERVLRQFNLIAWTGLAVRRAIEESFEPALRLPEREFKIHPSLEESIGELRELRLASHLSVDIETAAGQITCIGFASRPERGICIPTLPRDYSPEDFYLLWTEINKTLSGPAKKIGQNFVYDLTYLSAYGIRTRNFHHDTMRAQKFLYPELTQGLDSIARIWTREPYWKDEGKNWGLRQNIDDLYRYNVKDVCVTLEAALAQETELRKRGKLEFFRSTVMPLVETEIEMSWQRLRINKSERERLREEASKDIEENLKILNEEASKVLDEPVNPKSPAQVKRLLKLSGFRVPMKNGKESSDKESLIRLKIKNPESKILLSLLRLSERNKQEGSYLNYKEGREKDLSFIRATFNSNATESNRWASYKDPFGLGFNALTIPKSLRSQFVSEPDEIFYEIDLKQADARVVAWEGNETRLMEMFRDGSDIHKFVAAEILKKPEIEVVFEERQLGKKVGHGGNYGMKGFMLAVTCLKELELVIEPREAEGFILKYHHLFPGIRKRHFDIQQCLRTSRTLKTPLGRERVFYGRLDESTFQEAYAWSPQSIVADIMNSFILCFRGHCRLYAHKHDSVILGIKKWKEREFLKRVCDQDAWNPKISLPGGELRIPIEVVRGTDLKNLEKIYEG